MVVGSRDDTIGVAIGTMETKALPDKERNLSTRNRKIVGEVALENICGYGSIL